MFIWFFREIDIEKIKLEAIYSVVADRITKEHTKLKEFATTREKIKYILARYTMYYQIKNII